MSRKQHHKGRVSASVPDNAAAEIRPKVGIITDDPLVAFAVYREVVAATPARKLQDHFDAVVYTRTLDDASDNFSLFEGTSAMKSVGCMSAVFPDRIDQAKLNEVSGKVPLQVMTYAFKGLPAITPDMLEGIRDNIKQKVRPDGELGLKYDRAMEMINQWADVCAHAATNTRREGLVSVSPTNKRVKEEVMLRAARDPNRFKNPCFVGVHGGMGPDSGNEALHKLGTDHKAAVFLVSACSTPNAAEFILDVIANRMEHIRQLLDPYPKIRHARELIKRMAPDSVLHACNTAQFFDDRLRSDGYSAVNIVEETVKRLPKDSRVLILGTTATVKSGLYAQALDRADRSDITFVKPKQEMVQDVLVDLQDSVNRTIWDLLMLGKYKEASQALFGVVKKYMNGSIQEAGKGTAVNGYAEQAAASQKETYALCACTEIIFGLAGILDKKKIIDPMEIATEVAAEQASAAQTLRRPRADRLSRIASGSSGSWVPGS